MAVVFRTSSGELVALPPPLADCACDDKPCAPCRAVEQIFAEMHEKRRLS